MRSCREYRRQEDEIDARPRRPVEFGRAMGGGGNQPACLLAATASAGEMQPVAAQARRRLGQHQQQAARFRHPGDSPGKRQARTPWQLMVAKDNSRSGRKGRQRLPQSVSEPFIGKEPAGRQRLG